MDAVQLAESGRIPDAVVRWGMRRLLAKRLRQEYGDSRQEQLDGLYAFLEAMESSPVALATDMANEQHYEVPAEFFVRALGPRLKYSSCYWPSGVTDLAAAEAAMLKLTCERAGLADGMDILELGCGWGSLTLWMAEMYPESCITAVSNSRPQREFIEARCRERGWEHVKVLTADMNGFSADGRFDRVVSVEMFEHMRNVGELLRRICGWIRPDGRLFIHIFCHRELAYPFETEVGTDWMARYFFTGGMMPSESLPFHLQRDMTIERHWRVNGRHYERTLNAWLANMDRERERILSVFAETYGAADADIWFRRWRMFMMACAELFGYAGGEEWYVGHYRMRMTNGDQ